MTTRLLVIVLSALMVLAGCSSQGSEVSGSSASSAAPPASTAPAKEQGQIYLYGETHGIKRILEKELELWNEYYHGDNMRHLFVELPYYTAEFLNIWIRSDSDDILDALYSDWEGTALQVPSVKEFYRQIKADCPETIFHGTDVGHQYNTTGARFAYYLKQNNLQDTEQYSLALEAIEQGRYYHDNNDDAYRENKMTENFTREFELLNGEDVMGIYGGAHTVLDAMDDSTNTVPCMAIQLKDRYGEAVNSEDLTWIAKDVEPERIDTITVDGTEYAAEYYGKEEIGWSDKMASRECWRLENAYDDFEGCVKTGDILPYDNYPMLLEKGQVFVIDYVTKEGAVIRMYYRSDGAEWEGAPVTEEFTPGQSDPE